MKLVEIPPLATVAPVISRQVLPPSTVDQIAEPSAATMTAVVADKTLEDHWPIGVQVWPPSLVVSSMDFSPVPSHRASGAGLTQLRTGPQLCFAQP